MTSAPESGGSSPRLLYVGDVAIEATLHGSALLYRLLQAYPADRLMIVEGDIFPALSDRKLPGVRYERLAVGRPRFLNSRGHDVYATWLSFIAGSRSRRLDALVDGFSPDAVLTVAHGYSWLTAAGLAHRRRLPLHLIMHDDWPSVVPRLATGLVVRQFGEVYRRAASRLCVSPYMATEYERRYGAPASVLYPARGADAPVFAGPPERLRGRGRLTIAFAGTINSPGYGHLLRTVADCLEPCDGRLLLFGPLSDGQAASAGLLHPRIERRGLLTSAELMTRLRAEADALLIPMSFAPADMANMQMSFPSKLTDYTAVALPLLICGPPYCSAVQWAAGRPGVAEVVTTQDREAIAAAVARLGHYPEHRVALAVAAKEAGDLCFSAAAAAAVFQAALAAGRSS